jgi:uncharacterized protein (DUF58 family)
MVKPSLTRQGIAVAGSAGAAIAIGRIFGVIELYVIGAGFLAAVAVALAYVAVRHPRIEADRWIHPSVLIAGDNGQVDIRLHHTGRLSSPPIELEEPVVRTMTEGQVARLSVPPLRAASVATSGYRVPTSTRGLVRVGPLRLVVSDLLGLARSAVTIAGSDEIVVAPRTLVVDMPELGRGPLGKALLESARRLGPGDFHGLREYAVGDELRSIHWRASARTDDLMVKEFSVEDLRRCTVVFDPSPGVHGEDRNFEHGVTSAASLVSSAMRAGLATRFVTADGIDLRGPEVVHTTQRVLARIEPSDGPLPTVDNDMADGLVLLVVITGSASSAAWRATRAIADPGVTRVLVSTNGDAESRGLSVGAGSEDEFVAAWQTMVGKPIVPQQQAPLGPR